jgi:hypothetical protein
MPPRTFERFSVCLSGREPTLAAGALFGDERPELVIGCADRWEVVAMSAAGPMRVATFRAPPLATGTLARAGSAASGDVDGDGAPDLVLPLALEADDGAVRGGGLYWIARDGFGGIREPAALAPIAAFDAAITAFDAQSGAEVLGLSRGNPIAQVPSDVWVFSGGAAPSRRAALPAGLAGDAVRVGDVDRDGHTDAVTLARDRIGVAFGDGLGAFPRTRAFELQGVRELALGDVDGDGGLDITLVAGGLRWIRGGPMDELEPRPIEGAPSTLRSLNALDLDGDGRSEIAGWDHPRWIVIRVIDGAARTEPALTLAGGPFGPRRALVADLDGDGARDDLALLGSAGEDSVLELVVVPDALGVGDVTTSESARSLPSAPLTLDATLPSAG